MSTNFFLVTLGFFMNSKKHPIIFSSNLCLIILQTAMGLHWKHFLMGEPKGTWKFFENLEKCQQKFLLVTLGFFVNSKKHPIIFSSSLCLIILHTPMGLHWKHFLIGEPAGTWKIFENFKKRQLNFCS